VSPSAPVRKRSRALSAQGIATAGALVGALLTCVLFVLTSLGPGWLVRVRAGSAGNAMLFLPIVAAFVSGVFIPGVVGFAAAVAVAASLQIDGFNPLFTAVPLSAWAVGFVIRDRMRLVAELDRAGAELRADSERLAEESVLYERARVARELHDIVAHCVSVIVIQAYAGGRLLTDGVEPARAAFEHIEAIAAQARLEIRPLVDLLGSDESDAAGRRLSANLEVLVSSAREAGLDVELQLEGDVDSVSAAVAKTAYSVARESLTNALKHAPGGAVRIGVERLTAKIRVVVTDTGAALAGARQVALGPLGGGHGIAGIRARVLRDGGHLTAGPAVNGGWCVEAEIPWDSAAATSR
jgi:signal transduction histidine kinase